MYTHILQYKNPVQAAYLTVQCHLWLLLIWLLLTSVCNYKASLFVYFLFVAVDIRCFLRSSREVVVLLPCSCLRPRQYYLDYALGIHYIAFLSTHTQHSSWHWLIWSIIEPLHSLEDCTVLEKQYCQPCTSPDLLYYMLLHMFIKPSILRSTSAFRGACHLLIPENKSCYRFFTFE